MNARPADVLRIIVGVLLCAAWIAGTVVVITLSFMGTLMANDAGTVSASAQAAMVALVFVGQILAGAAGIPLGLACFWRTRRKVLLVIFAAVLGSGVLLQVVGVGTFLAARPR